MLEYSFASKNDVHVTKRAEEGELEIPTNYIAMLKDRHYNDEATLSIISI